VSKDAGAGEARYGGLVDTRLYITLILRMRSVAEDMEFRLLVYSVKDTPIGEDEAF
jgi:hypothetical protein